MAERRARRATRLGAAVTAPLLLAGLAVMHPGAHVTQVDLHDGAVWLTHTTAMKLGRYNPQVDELNGGLVAASTDMDVLQDGGDVLLLERGQVSVVDPASVSLAARADVPAGSRVSLADGVVAVSDARAGDVWVSTVDRLGSVDPASPDLSLGEGGAALAAEGGAVLTVTAQGELGRLGARPDGGSTEVADAGRLDLRGDVAGAQVTAVGEELVLLAGTWLHTAGTTTDLGAHGPDLVLQQPGPRDDHVLVATPAALLEVPLDGGDVRSHPTGAAGRPAAPVRVGTCAHGAWASPQGSYQQVCDGRAEVLDLQGMSTADELVFRVNRGTVVLNDTRRGRLWVPLEDPDLREPNWQDIEPEEETQDEEQDSDSRQGAQNLQAECTASSGSPSAQDDEYGVRAGRTTILSVIDNDTASDCGVLTISDHDDVPETFGTLALVHGGRALQLTTRPDASGTVEITYTISDGRGSTAPSTATVRLTVRGDGVDEAPVQVRVASVAVEQGASVRHHVLPDFVDPDGDHLVLAGATVDGPDTVRTRQDGELTYVADGGALGRQVVRVLVSDGAHTVEGVVHVDVRPVGSLPPVVDPVHAETYVDQPVTVRPLTAVRSAGREAVRLAGVDEQAGVTIEPDLRRGTFVFTAPRAGTYYVGFTVSASPQQATGLARIDVREAPEDLPPPVAVLDVALLPPGGEVTVAPLANDVDPAGGVLVLQSVEVPDGHGLQAEVLRHELVRISSAGVLTAPVVLRYTISNGSASAVGEILVQPVPAVVGHQPPVVPDVTAAVRTGGVVTIPVLDGAYDPDGGPLSLDTQLGEGLGPDDGLMFVSGDVLRYQAPATPREVRTTFTVRDTSGQPTTATVRVTVHESDPAAKAPPRPRNLSARVLEGGTVRIPVPLVGIDPDGDGVQLLGQDRAPEKGWISEVGADWLEYRAEPGRLGTDVFTYAVEDWVGQRAVATVRVGIAPRPTTAATVVARDDAVVVRPGQRVEVAVLRNDSDTGGGELTLDEELVLEEGVEAHVEGRRVVVRTPDHATVQQIGYTARNDRGGHRSAVLTVTVDPEAPFEPPVARDVVVPATRTLDRTSIEVDVLEVADNPSGPVQDLDVQVHPSAADVASVTPDKRVLVQLVDRPQTLPYLLRNTHPLAGGVSSYAFITVPALGDFPPVRRPRAPQLRVVAGEPLTVSLEEQIQVAPGRTPRVYDGSRVSATRSDGSDLVVGPGTLRYVPERTYAGPAAISVEVHDGPRDQPTTRRSVITLPVTVLAAQEYPPVFSPSLLDVGPGETVRVDLGVFTSAPAGTAGEATYRYRRVSAPPPGFTVDVVGSVLTVRAAEDVPRGTLGGVTVEIDHGGSAPVTGQVEFRAVASSRPLVRLVDQVLGDGVVGTTRSVAPLQGAFNPFPGSPLTLVDAVVEDGTGTVSVAGNQLALRPGAVGTLWVRYRVRDVTGDPDREVVGRVALTVRARPDTPRAPRVVEVRDRTVVLAWESPNPNGEPITGYRVVVQPGGGVRECAVTTCTIDGLTNDVEHTFTVAARNAVDWSDPSPASAPARPDAVPDAPPAPRVTFGDAQLALTWGAPSSPGSAITGYTVEISPATRAGRTSFTSTATSLTVGDLQNGTEYQVRVRAQNRVPDPGPWSPWAAEVPARPPDAPTVEATRVEGPLGRQIQVRWTPGASGGDPVAGYDLVISGDGRTRTVAGLSATSYLLDDARNGVPYRFEVRARNKAGPGPVGSATASTFGVPGVPGDLRLTASTTAEPGQGTVRLTWARADGNGSPVTHHRLRVDGVESALDHTRTEHTLTGLTGGTETRVRVQACNVAGCGAWTEPVVATALTLPSPVQGLVLDPPADVDGWPSRLTARWSVPAQWGGAGGQVHEYRFSRDGTALADWARTSGTSASLDLPRSWFLLGGQARIAVEVRPRTDAGPGAVVQTSTTVSASPPGQVRDAALAVHAVGPAPAVRATWSPPPATGVPAVEHYEVRFREAGRSWTRWIETTDTVLVHDVRGPGTVQVEIRAVNGVGAGQAAAASVVVPEPEPEPDPDPDPPEPPDPGPAPPEGDG